MQPAVSFARVSRHFGDVRAVDDVSFAVGDGEFFAMLGPSGSGKTTCLRLIAGFEAPDAGEIALHGQSMLGVPPYDRRVNTVFQDYALFPHMSVRDNVEYGLKVKKVARDERRDRAEDALAMVQLSAFGARKPSELSGGQRQRVALGRAIVREPKAFLMDEPLSNLDAKLRVQMRTEIAKLHNRIGTTTIYVTHDQTEAMTMADRIVVLKDGEVQQVDSPQQMYDHPNNVFVAGFIGSPAMNFLRARLEKENGSYAVTFGDTRMPLSREVVGEVKERRGQDLGEHVGDVVLGIRPEHMEDSQTEAAEALGGPQGTSCVDVEAQVIESMGSEKYIYFEPPREQAVHLESIGEMTEDEEGGAEEDTMGGSAEDVGGNLMVARVAPESTAREGQTMRLVVDPSKIRIFDLETEQAIL
jgi:multiple sugar transport system ATP-binding protein